MKILWSISILLWGFSLGIFLSCDSKPDPRIVEIDEVFHALNVDQEFSGNVLVAEKGKIHYQKSFGYSNIENKTSLTSQSIFNIASISKTFTAVGVMQLEEEGLLGLDDTIKSYFPDCPYYSITVRHLITHTSGLTRIQSQPFRKEIESKGYDNHQIKDIYFKLAPKPHFEPGAHHFYANTNYLLLALIVEQVSEEPFHAFLASRVFEKAGMNSSFLHVKRVPQALRDKVVSYYIKPTWLSNAFVDTQNLDNRKSDDLTFANTYGFSDIQSTTEDLLKFHLALQNGTLLKKESLEKLYAPFHLKDDKEYTVVENTNYPWMRALGWYVSKEDPNIVFHAGGSIGGRNFFIRHLAKDQCIVVLANNQEMNRFNFTFPMRVMNNQEYELDPISLPRAFCTEYLKNGIEPAVRLYKDNQNNARYTQFIDFDFEEIGDELMDKKDVDAATALYQLYVDAIPDEFSWELLGSAYLAKGDKVEAKKCLEKSLEINPEHESALQTLREMDSIRTQT